jgi:hypothetical protein
LALSSQYDKHALCQLGDYKEDYGLAGASDGAATHHVPLINFLTIVCSIAELLEVVGCSGYIEIGGLGFRLFILIFNFRTTDVRN